MHSEASYHRISSQDELNTDDEEDFSLQESVALKSHDYAASSSKGGVNIPLQPLSSEASQLPQKPPPSVVLEMDSSGIRRGKSDWPADVSLDKHLAKVYEFYRVKGFRAGILSRVFQLFSMLFIVCFSIFLIICIDYSMIREMSKNTSATFYLKDAIDLSRLRPTTASVDPGYMPPILIVFLVLFALYWCWNLYYLLRSVPSFYRMKQFYEHVLKISEDDIETTEWTKIVNALIHAYRSRFPSKKLDHTDIANRILRRENYWIAFFSHNVVDLRLNICGYKTAPFMTKWMEWVLQWSILDLIFDDNNCVKRKYQNPENKDELIKELKKRFRYFGIIGFIFSPFIFMFLFAYFLLRYGEEFHKNPNALGLRQYTYYARAIFREYNEYTHEFERRLNLSYKKATEYLSKFPDEKLAIFARLVAFIFGSFAFAIGIASILNEDLLLNLHLTENRSMLWYFGIFSAIFAFANAFIPEENSVFEPNKIFDEVYKHTHQFKHWQNWAHTNEVRKEFSSFFEYKVVIVFNEILGIIIVPLVLLFKLQGSAEKIITFFVTHTVKYERVGYICSPAAFDFKNKHFSKEPVMNEDGNYFEEGKMEQSFFTFTQNNPDYVSDKGGQEFLRTVRELTQSQMGNSVLTPDAATSPGAPSPNTGVTTPWILMTAKQQQTSPEYSSTMTTSSVDPKTMENSMGASSGLSSSEREGDDVTLLDRMATGVWH